MFIVFLIEVVVLSIYNFLMYVPSLARCIFKNYEFLHRNVVSDIPGNHHSLDPAIVSLLRILPEPSDFTCIWTGLSFDEPLLMKGILPTSRYNSLSVYGRRTDEPPNSIELNADQDGYFEVLILNEQHSKLFQDEKMQKIYSNHWNYGFITMRNYLIPSGSRVVTPQIVRYKDNKVIRLSNSFITGPVGIDLGFSKEIVMVIRIVLINLLILFINHLLFNMKWNDKINMNIIFISIGLSLLLYKTCFLIGYYQLRKLSYSICKDDNQFYLVSSIEGSRISQPSLLHKYWMMRFSIPYGKELSITGVINQSYQKYWSIVIYDEYGLPLPQYVYDESVTRINNYKENDKDDSTKESNIDSTRNDKAIQYAYDIRLKHISSLRNDQHFDSINAKHTTIIDLNNHYSGYILFRINHPIGEHVVTYSNPSCYIYHSPMSLKENEVCIKKENEVVEAINEIHYKEN